MRRPCASRGIGRCLITVRDRRHPAGGDPPTPCEDVLGLPAPCPVTVGSGAATVLCDGRRADGRWSRPTPDAGTRFVYGSGSDILLRPGPTWVLLVPDGQPLTTS